MLEKVLSEKDSISLMKEGIRNVSDLTCLIDGGSFSKTIMKGTEVNTNRDQENTEANKFI